MSNKSYATTRAVTNAYLAITQDISQSLDAQQLVTINCDSYGKTSKCASCVNWWNSPQNIGAFDPPPTSDNINELCSSVCNCKANNIQMAQTITINFNAFLRAGARDNFATQLKNSLSQSAKTNNTAPPTADTANLSQTADQLYASMTDEVFQKSLQGLSSLQVVAVTGPSSVVTVNLSQAIDYIDKILESNNVTANIINEYDTRILQATSQLITGGINELIEWLIQIVLFVVILVILFFSINLILDALTLAVI